MTPIFEASIFIFTGRRPVMDEVLNPHTRIYACSSVPKTCESIEISYQYIFTTITILFIHRKKTRCEKCLRSMSYSSSIDYTLRLKVVSSIPDEVIGFYS
jgi:hypothetical protein